MDSFTDDAGPPSAASQFTSKAKQRFQVWLDKSAPHVTGRWLFLVALWAIYALRVYYLKGFYIVTYALGIFNLNLLLGFLTPQVDPELEGPTLPSKSSESEFRPFVRRLPEFKFWFTSARALCIAFVMTFFPIFDVPVFWPILLLYWCVLFFLTMKRQIRHMLKHKYVPFTVGKKKGGADRRKGSSKDLLETKMAEP